ncbi:hypothetical protein ACIGXA_33890 [Streptomyces fildesensis]|uniref:Uncharacterized protein n=1 Tax=Streptomyces fildesensis TaxID=375757 RepID=A0ABW8CJF3_9ACTN
MSMPIAAGMWHRDKTRSVMAMSVLEEQQLTQTYRDLHRGDSPSREWFGVLASALRVARARRMLEMGEAAPLLPGEVGHVRMPVALS